MIRLSLAAVVAVVATAAAQPIAKPDPKAQMAASAMPEGGGPDTAYVVVLVTETQDKRAAKTGATVLDILSVPLRAGFWLTGHNSPLPWVSPTVDVRSSWTAEVGVFADRKSAAEAITGFGLAAPTPNTARTWRLLKKTEGLAAAIKAADAENAKLDKQAKANARLTVTRRPDPAKK